MSLAAGNVWSLWQVHGTCETVVTRHRPIPLSWHYGHNVDERAEITPLPLQRLTREEKHFKGFGRAPVRCGSWSITCTIQQLMDVMGTRLQHGPSLWYRAAQPSACSDQSSPWLGPGGAEVSQKLLRGGCTALAALLKRLIMPLYPQKQAACTFMMGGSGTRSCLFSLLISEIAWHRLCFLGLGQAQHSKLLG